MKNIALIALLLYGLAACTAGSPPPSTDTIDTLEAEMRALDHLDTALALRTLEAYRSYQQDYPQDSLVPELMLREANLLKEMATPYREQALEVLTQMQEQHPEHQLAPRALFMQAFILDESLRRKKEAARMYGLFAERYPRHPMAHDAELLQKMALQSTQEQLQQIREMQQKAAENNSKTD